MKVVIATKDGIHIANSFFDTDFYRVFTLEHGKIVDEEQRKSISKESKENCIDESISDCNFYIINHFEIVKDDIWDEDADKAFVKTKANLITNIIYDFNEEQKRIESNN